MSDVKVLIAYLKDVHDLVDTLLGVYAEKYGKGSFVEIEARKTIVEQKKYIREFVT